MNIEQTGHDAPCLSIFRRASDEIDICSAVSTCGASEVGAVILPPPGPAFCSMRDMRSMLNVLCLRPLPGLSNSALLNG